MPQTLILEVAGRHAAQFGSQRRKAFEGRGGSIGRGDDCDWVLSVTAVSRVHAVIRHLNGMYFIEDRSTNGMLLNGAPLIKGDPSALNNGDRLLIDTFEVEISLRDADELLLESAAAQPAEKTQSVNAPFDYGLPAPPAVQPFHAPQPAEAESIMGSLDQGWNHQTGADDLDPLSFLGPANGTPVPVAAASQGAPNWNHAPGTMDHFRPPMTVEQRQVSTLPENWDMMTGVHVVKPAPKNAAPEPAPPPRPQPAVAPVRAAAPPPPPPPAPVAAHGAAAALPADVDQIFRIVVDGVMDVLRARAEIKNTFRLPMTVIQRSENNPLKFAPTPEDALQRIMAPPSAAFLSGTAAFQDAFDDIRCHQMAMLAGVRAAFESLLVHFGPERYEREVDGGTKRSGFMDFAGKGKYWDKYRENFDALSKNPDECFRRLFGDEFARAYEEQLSRLKSARRMQHGNKY